MLLEETADYHEDYGNCLFFHFPSFEEPPEAYIGSPLECKFEHGYWTHFTKDIDFNLIISQAMEMARSK